jgi:hypothetical protein
MSKAREPLYEIAAKLNNIIFDDPDKSVADNFHEQEVLGCIRHYIIRPSRFRRLWTVRVFVAGKTRTIGATERGADAARFADMAVRRFARYRLRSRGHNDNLNFPVAQSDADFANEQYAVELLDEIENYFLANGLIIEPQSEQPKQSKPRGLKSDIAVLRADIADLTESLRLLHEKVDRLSSIGSGIYPSPGVFKHEVSPMRYDAPPQPGLAPVTICKNDLDVIAKLP